MMRKTLFYHSQELTHADVADILRDLSFAPEAQTLVLSNNRLGDEGVRLLAAGLADFPQITRVALRDNQLTDESCRHIATMRQIEWLDLSSNPISDAGLEFLV